MYACMTAVYSPRRIAIIMKPHIMLLECRLQLKSLALPQGLLLTEYNIIIKTAILMQNTIIHMAHDLQSHNCKQVMF